MKVLEELLGVAANATFCIGVRSIVSNDMTMRKVGSAAAYGVVSQVVYRTTKSHLCALVSGIGASAIYRAKFPEIDNE